MTAEQILERLRTIAPHIAFDVSYEQDPSFVWDGDGPDPADDGFYAVDVTVSAKTILKGVAFEGNAYMGGHYLEYGEKPDGDIGGYLPQMLEEAAEELKPEVESNFHLRSDVLTAIDFLRQEMKDRYEAQRMAVGEASWNVIERHRGAFEKLDD